MLLEAQPRAVQLARDTLAHRDHEGRPDEDADLPELDLLALAVVTRGAQDHEVHVPLVLLDLRPQVIRLRVFHRQLVQVEALAHLLQFLGSRLEHAQPHEPALPAPRRGFLQRDRTRVLTMPLAVVSAIDDHRRPFNALS